MFWALLGLSRGYWHGLDASWGDLGTSRGGLGGSDNDACLADRGFGGLSEPLERRHVR